MKIEIVPSTNLQYNYSLVLDNEFNELVILNVKVNEKYQKSIVVQTDDALQYIKNICINTRFYDNDGIERKYILRFRYGNHIIGISGQENIITIINIDNQLIEDLNIYNISQLIKKKVKVIQ